MKCIEGNEALGICINCGKAICNSCKFIGNSTKYVCSSACNEEVVLHEHVTRLTLSRATNSAKASAYGSYVLAAIFLIFAIFEWFKNPNATLATFLLSAGFGLGIMGFLIIKSAKSSELIKTDNKS
jgi:hypothetical protein